MWATIVDAVKRNLLLFGDVTVTLWRSCAGPMANQCEAYGISAYCP